VEGNDVRLGQFFFWKEKKKDHVIVEESVTDRDEWNNPKRIW
jgi:hypothetical protein